MARVGMTRGRCHRCCCRRLLLHSFFSAKALLSSGSTHLGCTRVTDTWSVKRNRLVTTHTTKSAHRGKGLPATETWTRRSSLRNSCRSGSDYSKEARRSPFSRFSRLSRQSRLDGRTSRGRTMAYGRPVAGAAPGIGSGHTVSDAIVDPRLGFVKESEEGRSRPCPKLDQKTRPSSD